MADIADRVSKAVSETLKSLGGALRRFWPRFERRTEVELQEDERSELPSGEVHWSDVPGAVDALSNFRLYGEAWFDEANASRILLVYGAPAALRGLVSQFLPERKIAYPKRGSVRTAYAVRSLGPSRIEIGSFGKRAFTAFAFGVRSSRLNSSVLRLRQRGRQLAYPLAIAIDGKGDFRDCTASSDYEALLNEAPLLGDAALRQVRAQLKYMIKEQITLHARGGSGSDPEALGPKVRKRVLIVGLQGSRGARSAGGEENWSDEELIRLAMRENDGADFVFLPNRKAKQAETVLSERMQRKVAIIRDGVSSAEILRHVDHVYVGSSLVGLDALIRGLEVTTVGTPFYAGWGLSDDRAPGRRRHAKLTIEQLIYLTFHRYFRYLGAQKPGDGFSQALRRIAAFQRELSAPVVWPKEQPFLEDTIVENADANLALASEDLLPEGVKTDPVMAIYDKPVPDDFVTRLSKTHSPATAAAVLALVAKMLGAQVRYDELKSVVQQYRDWFERLQAEDLAVEQARAFLVEYASILKKMFGRSVERGPAYDALRLMPYRDFLVLLPPYVRVLSANIEYARAEEVIRSREIFDPEVLLKLTAVFSERPGRSERDGFTRARLRRYCATRALDEMDREFGGWTNSVINRLLYFVALDDEMEVITFVERLIEGTPEPATLSRDQKNRLRKTQAVARYLIRQKNFEAAERLIQHISPVLRPGVATTLRLQYQVSSGDREGAILSLDQSNNERSQKLRLRLQWNAGVRGGEMVKRIARGTNVDEAKRARFIQQTSDLINAVPQPIMPKAMVFLGSLGCLNTLAMIAPMIVELKRKGYAVQHLSEGVLENVRVNDRTTFSAANDIAGSIPRGNSDGTLQLEWRIDWPNRIVESNGVNFYQGIYERLSTHFRCFHIDVSDPEVGRWFKRYLVATDTILRTCLRIEQELVREGVPVVLIVGNSHVTPYSVFRDFCRARNNPKLRLTTVNIAYENYYSNLGSKFSGSMAVVDSSLYPDCRAPFLAIPERFERWYAQNEASPEIETKVQTLLQANRNQSVGVVDGSKLDVLKKARESGKKVVCIFGKILCDLAVPYDGGPGHADIVDWVRHTVEVVRGHDLVLVIKPHPHELRPEIALDLTEMLTDVLPDDLPENVMVLGHREYNVHEIASQIDIAVLWNGTSALELSALGFPVMMCSHFGRHDYPIDLIYPESREQYASYLRAGQYEAPSPELRRKAMGLLHYMGTEDVALPNRFSRRSSTNDSVGVPVWLEEEWSRYLADGDRAIATAAFRAVEGLERKIDA